MTTLYREQGSGRYPITLDEIRGLLPLLFGEEPSPLILTMAAVDPVEATEPPSFDPATQRLVEGAPVLSGGVWRQSWSVKPLPVVVPARVTMRQAKLALHRSGFLTAADATIAAMPGDAGVEARIEWSTASALERNHPLVAALGTELGLTAEEIDGLFVFAATL